MTSILDSSVGVGSGVEDDVPPSLVSQERNLVIPYDLAQVEILYRQTREIYTQDQKKRHALIIYISSMVQLHHQHELFYLSHQLTASQPNDAISWYAVGAYYWAIQKYEQAHKYLKKALKKDKDCTVAWILLGHVLSVVEESEQALAAYRSVVRLLPDNHLPLLCIGKEFIRTNNLWLAAHTLQGAQALQPQNITILNELGVAFVKLNKLREGLEYFRVAIVMVEQQMQQHQTSHSRADSLTSAANVCELLYNYATALRKEGELEEALTWYQRSLSLGPLKPAILAAIGFTHHLARRFDDAVVFYHQALSIEPKYTFCSEMLTHAMNDMFQYEQETVTSTVV